MSEPHHVVTETTRASLPVRDYVVGTCVIVAIVVGNVLYCERRLATAEEATRAVSARVLALEAGDTAATAKTDWIVKTINDINVSVARIEERTRKP